MHRADHPAVIAFVIFGSLTGVSIGALFLAGVRPGLLMGVYLMAACYLVARRRGYGADPGGPISARSGGPSGPGPRC